MSTKISYQIVLSTNFENATTLVKEALGEQGFGVLTEIDVRATLKKKLGADFRAYTILGACNPSLAHQALSIEPDVGVMLPCNVTLDEKNEGILVSFVNPDAMMTIGEFGENLHLREIAAEANDRIRKVVESLRA
jgi:uncharacterized protein (DUF302 family)